MCGEKYKIKKRYPLEMGSPPHVRGKALKDRRDMLNVRITPACAGKSRILSAKRFMKRDHPRMCGEK